MALRKDWDTLRPHGEPRLIQRDGMPFATARSATGAGRTPQVIINGRLMR